METTIGRLKVMYAQDVIQQLTYSQDWRSPFVVITLKPGILQQGIYYEEWIQAIESGKVQQLKEGHYFVRVLSLKSIQNELDQVQQEHPTVKKIKINATP